MKLYKTRTLYFIYFFLIFLANKVIDVSVKRLAEELLEILQPIAIAVDAVQANQCKIGDSVEIWKILKDKLKDKGQNIVKCFEARFDKTITDAHFAAFMLSPKEHQSKLSADERARAISFFEANFSINFINDLLMKFLSKGTPFRKSFFENISMTDFEWWKSVALLCPEVISNVNLDAMGQILTASSSSAGLERTFSKFGLTQTALRNKLGNEKTAKLVFVSQRINKK